MNNSDITPDSSPVRPADRDRSLRFWLRAAGAAMADDLARTLADDGLDRRDWMVLNVLTGEKDAPGLAERIRRGGKRVRALAARGWVTEADGGWTATELGRSERERIAARIAAVRGRAAETVAAENLATTVASLEAIARAHGWNENTAREAGPRGRHGFGRRFGFGPGFGPGRRCSGDEHDVRPDHQGRPHHSGAHPHDRGEHGGHPGHRGERAFERGFTAGFRAGRDVA
ncbi:hypothetical protein [Microbacterium radiodurans]|uniref:MarR family transcriptional regulator n=1 Tax=Microbacterium radiodurans TaxID=661398 RepID=A0A5J5IU38_9MICO|nr:hypothetical protein [Microbacterium radiodurans]KAA9089089.1 hypothetical protein F6B42_00870 [Microbacterium radiodurans]